MLHRRGRLHPAHPIARVRGQQPHGVQLVQPHRQTRELDGAEREPRARDVRARIREPLERLTARHDSLDGLEQAVTHDHHGEDLHAASRHVHHETRHADGLHLRHGRRVRRLEFRISGRTQSSGAAGNACLASPETDRSHEGNRVDLDRRSHRRVGSRTIGIGDESRSTGGIGIGDPILGTQIGRDVTPRLKNYKRLDLRDGKHGFQRCAAARSGSHVRCIRIRRQQGSEARI